MLAAIDRLDPPALIMVDTTRSAVRSLAEDPELGIPSVTVSPDVALALLAQPDAPISLSVKAATFEGRTANVVARNAAGPSLVVCAHHDTKIGTPGATDNAIGLAGLLSLSETPDLVERLPAIELVAFGNEEYLPMGDDTYVEKSGGFDRFTLAINLDGIGHRLGADSVAVFNLSDNRSMTDAVKRVLEGWPGAVLVPPWPEGEKLKQEVLVLDWKKRQATRAAVQVSIEHLLDDGLPDVYDRTLFSRKSSTVFEHIFSSYQGDGMSIYEDAA